MKAVGAAIVVALALLAFSGAAEAGGKLAILSPAGDGVWCNHHPPRGTRTCGGLLRRGERQHYAVGVVRFDRREPVENFSYRACSESPTGKRRCVLRRTSHKLAENGWHYSVDFFRFEAAFPHRRKGTYKLTWWQHGEQLGRTVRFELLGHL